MGPDQSLGPLTHCARFSSVTHIPRRSKAAIARSISSTKSTSPPGSTLSRNELGNDPGNKLGNNRPDDLLADLGAASCSARPKPVSR